MSKSSWPHGWRSLPGYGKVSAYNAGDPDLISGLGRSPGEGKGNRPQYSCLENSMDRGVYRGQRVRDNWSHLLQNSTAHGSWQPPSPPTSPRWQAGLHHCSEAQLLSKGMWMALTSFLIFNLFTWRLRAEVKITKHAVLSDIQGECYFSLKVDQGLSWWSIC